MEGEWSCYRGSHFNGERMDVTEVVTLIRGTMVMLWRWPV